MKRKQWKGSVNCILCGVPEDVNHLFFGCSLAQFFWVSFKATLGWDKIPSDLKDFYENWLPLNRDNYNARMFIFTVGMLTLVEAIDPEIILH